MKLFCSTCHKSFEIVLPLTNIPMADVESPCGDAGALLSAQVQDLIDDYENRKSLLLREYTLQIKEESDRFRTSCDGFEDYIMKYIKQVELEK